MNFLLLSIRCYPVNLIDIFYLIITAFALYFSLLFLIIFWENKQKIKEVPKIDKLPTVTLIVPAHNEEKKIVNTITCLKNLNYPKKLLEIIVVDDGSTDRTAEVAKKTGVKVIRKEKGGKANALNYALKYAKGEIVGVVDADSYPEPNALMKSLPFFSDPMVASVTTRILAKDSKGLLGKLQEIEYALIAWTRKLLEYVDSIQATPGPLSLYRRKILNELGGFDENNATEDIEIAWRLMDAGYKIRMAGAETKTEIPKSIRGWWKQRIRWNIGGFQTSYKYRKSAFRKGSGTFGFFVVPFSVISYVLSILLLSVIFYFVIYHVVMYGTYLISALSIGLNPLKYLSLPVLDTFFVFVIPIAIMTVAILVLGLSGIKNMRSGRSWLEFAVFLGVYIALYPFVLIDSLIKYARGYREW